MNGSCKDFSITTSYRFCLESKQGSLHWLPEASSQRKISKGILASRIIAVVVLPTSNWRIREWP